MNWMGLLLFGWLVFMCVCCRLPHEHNHNKISTFVLFVMLQNKKFSKCLHAACSCNYFYIWNLVIAYTKHYLLLYHKLIIMSYFAFWNKLLIRQRYFNIHNNISITYTFVLRNIHGMHKSVFSICNSTLWK